MDPITSISLASSAAQLADFMVKLLSGTRAIYNSATGISDENENIETVASELQRLTTSLLDSSDFAAGTAGPVVAHTAKSCGDTAKQLLEVLSLLKREDKTVWKSFRAALKTVMNKKRVDSLYATACRLQSTLVAQLQLAVLKSNSSMNQIIRQIDERTMQLGINRAELLQSLRDGIQEEVKEAKEDITLFLDSLKSVSGEDNRPVRSTESRPNHEGMGEAVIGTKEDESWDYYPHDEPVTASLQALVSRLVDELASLMRTARERDNEQSFLSTLHYDTIRSRQEGIKAAHVKTFEWIFRNETPDGAQIQFASWLKKDNGIFWVRGKAGSGKSTLMKFIVQHPHATRMLRQWAGDNQLVVAKHFFWNSGSKMQMSQIGLFRTLIFELLRSCPETIPQIRKLLPHVTGESYQWNIEDILAVMECLAGQALNKNFCFFIDGLDEYEGDQDQLIEVLQSLASFRNTKVCCSSRPWTCFIDAFGQRPERLLKLEDLTMEDIRKYVRDSFDTHVQFRKHSRDPGYPDLIQDVVSRAQGVFLWVFLVVRSLRDGLTYADRVSDLQKRLDSLPPDLEAFFQHILDSIDPFYREQSSEVFVLACYAPESMPLVIFTILDDLDESPSKLMSLSLSAQQLGSVDVWKDQMTRRLDARTKGLVEAKHRASPPKQGSRSSLNAEGHLRRGKPEQHVEFYAEFLHRTVRDFLLTNDINIRLRQQSRPNFSPAIRLCEAFLVLLRSYGLYQYDNASPRATVPLENVESFVYFAWRIEQELSMPRMDLMEAADKILNMVSWTPQETTARYHEPSRWHSLFALALERGVNLYALQCLRQKPDKIKETASLTDYPLLTLAILPSTAPFHHPTISIELVKVLLDLGVAPTARTQKVVTTPWEALLRALTEHPMRLEWKDKLHLGYADVISVVGAMISKGAPLNRKFSKLSARDIILSSFDEMDAKYLLGLSPMAAKTRNQESMALRFGRSMPNRGMSGKHR